MFVNKRVSWCKMLQNQYNTIPNSSQNICFIPASSIEEVNPKQ